MKALDVGCGHTKVAGAFGLDLHVDAGVDVVGDLRSLPFADGTFDRVHANNVLEHFTWPLDVPLPEIRRILKADGELHVLLPHYTSPGVLASTEHKYAPALLTVRQWAQYDPPRGWRRCFNVGGPSGGWWVDRPWRLVSYRLIYHRLWRWMGIEWLANIYPELWEAFMVHLFPCRYIQAVLRPA